MFEFLLDVIPILIIIVFIAYYFFVKRGNISFWRKAKDNPNFVYKELIKDDAWVIDDGVVEIDKNEFVGPFRLYVPKINKTVKFYGKVGKFEESQKRIKKEILN